MSHTCCKCRYICSHLCRIWHIIFFDTLDNKNELKFTQVGLFVICCAVFLWNSPITSCLFNYIIEKLILIRYILILFNFILNMELIAVRIIEAVEKVVGNQGWGCTLLLPRISSILASIPSITQLQTKLIKSICITKMGNLIIILKFFISLLLFTWSI